MKAETYKTASSSCRQLRCRSAWRRMSLALLLLMLTTMTAWADEIPYIGADGKPATCTNATKITSDFMYYGGTDEEDDLWYYVDGTVEISNYIQFQDFSGSTNIILCDGASLKVKYLEAYNAINIYRQGGNTPGKITTTASDSNGHGLSAGNGDLSIYGGTIEISGSTEGIFSSGGNIIIADCNITISDKGGFTAWANYWGGGDIIINSGNITITDGNIYASKGENESGKGGSITINGGEITIDGGKFWSEGGNITITDGTITVEGYSGFESTGNVTINGGKITATPTGDYSYGISAGGDVTINGGEITATATGSGSYGIAGNNITLGDATITASSYEIYGSFKIADGLTLSDGTDAYSGTLYDGTDNGKFEDLETLNAALANKTLKKLPAYIDLTAKIVWNDNNDQYNKRPESVAVSLKANGSQIGESVLTEDENGEWKCTVNKPSLSNGTLIVYTWDVPNMPNGYGLTSNSADGTTTTLTLTLQQCGENVAWNYDASSKTLTISGSGAMADYSSADDQPWKDFRDEIESLVIKKDVTSIGSFAFTGCTALESVTYVAGTTLKNIGASAFAGCSSLASIIIPVGVTSIGASAFESCASLMSVTAYPQTPPTLGEDAFNDINENVAFTVRNEGYKTADGWSAWASKMTILDPSQFLPYIDANGNEAFCTNATKITSDFMYYGGTDEEDDLWYYVDGTVEISNYIQFQDFSGSTNIILCDGASLKVKYLEAYNAINIYRQGGNTPGKITTTASDSNGHGLSAGNGDLSIYGGTIEISGSTEGIFSSGGNIIIADCNITISDKGGFTAWANYWGGGDIIINSGNITITDGNIYASKGENESGKGGSITINGGEITIDGGKFWSEGGNITITDGTITVEGYSGFESTGNVTINGGKITATPTGDYSYGISAGGDVTINGGEITATATGSGSYGIAGNNITLGDATITASSYEIYGSFKIADGLTLSDGTDAYSGTLYDGTDNGKFEDLETLNAALANKTLKKLPDYIDLTARIVWNDNNNQYNMQPTSVNVKLMADGAEVEGATFELSGNNEWNCTVTNQPSLNEGELIDYSWEVNDVSGWYELSELAEATTTTLTFSIRQCGQEGTNVIWCYDPDSKTLTVSGTGLMMYYNSIQNADESWSNGAPWKDFANEIEAVVIEDGITYVGSNTFAHCPNISSVTLPAEEIYEIGPGAFADCTSLISIDIPMSVNKIDDQAFAGCSHLETVSIGYGDAASFTIGTEVFPATSIIIVPEAGLSGYQSATGWSTYQIAPATRTLFAANSTNQWMTWCDKNAYTKPEGVTVYTVSDVDDNTVSTAEVSGDVIPAYTPVLLYRTEAGADAVKATFNAVGTAPESYDSNSGIVETTGSGNATFLGIPGDDAYAAGDNNYIFAISDFSDTQSYVLRNGNFVAVDEDGGIGAHRCWLNVTKSTTNGARMLRINTGGENTGIETTNFTNSTNSSGAWYGIDGRKLDKQPTKKGLYINNGKKYVIK